MIIEIKNISLAAYIKMQGYQLLKVNCYSFSFDLPQSTSEEILRIEYLNSECSHHDTEVCNLRDMQRLVRDHYK